MAVKTISPRYETSDGQEWATQERAEKHEAMITARRNYEEARRIFGIRLAETQKTADGYPFEFAVLRDYYYVVPGWAGKPDIERVAFYGYNLQFEYRDDDDYFAIRQERNGHPCAYRITDLYRNKHAAEVALLAAQEEWLKEREAEIEELRSRLNG